MQADLKVVEGRVSYLESRVDRNEDLVSEIGGSARQEARQEIIASRQDMAAKLDEARKQNADMLTQLQQLQLAVQALQGEFAELEAASRQAAKLVSDVTAALAARDTAAPAPVAQSGTALTWSSESDIYDAARKAYEAKDMARARSLLEEQLTRWPSGKLAGNAQFWLGEMAYARQDYLGAVERYLNVAEGHKTNSKAPAAYLKLAMSLEKLGERDQALRTYRDLIRLFPKAEQVKAAESAIKRLAP